MNANFDFNKLAERIQAVQAAREKMFLYHDAEFTPKMANDYESLMSLLDDFDTQCQAMIDRGVDRFELGKFDIKIEKKRDFVKRERVKESWFSYKLNIIYIPLKCFLAYLQANKQCGWEVKVWGGSMGKMSIWITIFATDPRITEVNYANRYGEKITALRHWYDYGGH